MPTRVPTQRPGYRARLGYCARPLLAAFCLSLPARADIIASAPAEADTLATVTGRAATSAQSLTLTGATPLTLGADVAGGTTNVPGWLKLFSNGDNAYYTLLQAGTQTQDVTLTLPLDDGDSGQVLSTNGSGVLDWITPSTFSGVAEDLTWDAASADNDYTVGTRTVNPAANGQFLFHCDDSPFVDALSIQSASAYKVSYATDSKKFGTGSMWNADWDGRVTLTPGVAIGTSAFAFTFWVRNDETNADNRVILSNGGNLAVQGAMGGNDVYGIRVGGTTTNTQLTAGSWFWIAIVRASDNTVSIYKAADGDGSATRIATYNDATSISTLATLHGAPGWNGFAGYLDELFFNVGDDFGYSGASITVPSAAYSLDKYTETVAVGWSPFTRDTLLPLASLTAWASALGLGTEDSPSFTAVLATGATGVTLGTDAATNIAGSLKLWSAGANNYYTTITAGEQSQDIAYVLPANDGNVSQFLQTDGSGNLVWGTALTSESDTLANVTGRGATSSDAIYFTAKSALTLGEDKGAGVANSAGWLKLFSNGDNAYSTIIQAGTQTQNVTLTLPLDDGDAGQVLTTDGSGVLDWATIATHTQNTDTGTTSANFQILSGSSGPVLTGAAGPYLGIGCTSPVTALQIGETSTSELLAAQSITFGAGNIQAGRSLGSILWRGGNNGGAVVDKLGLSTFCEGSYNNPCWTFSTNVGDRFVISGNQDIGSVTGSNFVIGGATAAGIRQGSYKGTSATNTLIMCSGTAPSTSPADTVQVYAADQDGTAGNSGLTIRGEGGQISSIGNYASFPYLKLTSTPSETAGSIQMPSAGRIGPANDSYMHIGDWAGTSGTRAASLLLCAQGYTSKRGAFELSGSNMQQSPADVALANCLIKGTTASANATVNTVGGSLYLYGGNHSTTGTVEGSVIIANADGATKMAEFNEDRATFTATICIPLAADITTAQYGSVLMNDASADSRFDLATASSDAPIGVLADKVGATVQGTSYNVAVGGLGYVAPGEDETVTRGYICYGSTTTAGYAMFAATVGAANHNAEIGHPTESCPAYTISSTTGVDTGTETITVSGTHGWTAGTAVIYWNSGGTSIGGLTDGKVYWVISPSGATLKLSLTPGGSAVDLTDGGDDDTQYLMKLPLCIIHWN